VFTNLTDFAYKRTTKQALGFYLAYLLLIIILGALSGVLAGLALGENSYAIGLRVGNMVAILSVLVLSFVILHKKSLFKNFSLIIIALLSGVLAIIGGGLLGLIPAAYLTKK